MNTSLPLKPKANFVGEDKFSDAIQDPDFQLYTYVCVRHYIQEHM